MVRLTAKRRLLRQLTEFKVPLKAQQAEVS